MNYKLRIGLSFSIFFFLILLFACDNHHTDFGENNELKAGISAIRYANESFHEAKLRALGVQKRQTIPTSAVDKSVPLEEIDFSQLIDWGDYSYVLSGFEKGRDERFLDWSYRSKEFPRRISWMFPDDGCFLRADYLRENLEIWDYPETMKLFVFGNLKVNTDNHPEQSVTWWYHVVVIVANGDTPLVFDPAINPERPLSIEEWSDSMSKAADPDTFKYSLCNSETVNPNEDCTSPDYDFGGWWKEMMTNYFLNMEWSRIEELDRNPEDELGENPPWRKL